MTFQEETTPEQEGAGTTPVEENKDEDKGEGEGEAE